MKFLFVLSQHIENSSGGAEIQANFLANFLSDKGHEVVYACESENEISNQKYKVHCLDVPKKSFLSIINLFKIKDLISNYDPDIIYVRCKTPYLGICRIFSNKKIVYNLSANQDYSKRIVPNNLKGGGVNRISSNKIAKWSFKPYIIFDILNVFLFKYGLRRSLIISQTINQQKKLLDNYELKSTVIPNGHLPAQVINSKNVIISWIGNIKYFKNPIHFIKLARVFRKTKYKFVMAGRPGPSDLQKKLLMEIAKTDNVEYLGEISFEETNHLLSKSLVFVNTSFTEGFPNTFIQSWSHSTPVLSLYFDIEQILKYGKGGILSGTFRQLVKDLATLLCDEKKLLALSHKSLNLFEKNYQITKINDIQHTFFEKITYTAGHWS